MTAPAGAVVRIFVDSSEAVAVGHVIETTSTRRYEVLGVRVQQRGKHAGRQHLECLVLPDGDPARGRFVHRIFWYKRDAKRKR